MTPAHDPDARAFRATIARLIARDLDTARRTVQAYPDDASLWRLLGGLPNSAGTLALHLAGNLRHHIGAVLGGTGYVRDRAREFAARDLTRDAVAAELADAIDDVRATLARDDLLPLDAPFPVAVGGVQPPVRDLLAHLATHCAYHLGQMDAHRRGITGDATGVDAQALAPIVPPGAPAA